jgi:hypothetical protein
MRAPASLVWSTENEDRTGVHISDANEMLAREQFVCADCVWIDGRLVAFRIVDDAVVLDASIPVDRDDLTHVFAKFFRQVDGATYGGGEASAHGSCGFFFKRTGQGLDWALMSLASDPFIGVQAAPGQLRFRSQSGDEWVVEHDDPARTRIVRVR